MIDLTKLEEFDWDGGNINKNWVKHEVDNKECEEIFADENMKIFSDPKHSQDEEWFAIFGKSVNGRLLTAVFTIRNNKIRIISARDQDRQERKIYENQN